MRSEAILALRKDRPLFFYLHYRDVHEPYSPPPPFHKSFLPKGTKPETDILSRTEVPQDLAHRDLWVSQYDGEILYTDTILERTFAVFRTHGLRPDNAIFIITADHGEEFLDRHPGDTGGIGHSRTLYNELIRVPLIFTLPGTAGGKAIGTAVELNDILPTLIDVLDWDRRRAPVPGPQPDASRPGRGRPGQARHQRREGEARHDHRGRMEIYPPAPGRKGGPRSRVQGGALRSPI